MSWEEVADRCFRRRHGRFDVTVGVVTGRLGTVLVDTGASPAEGWELRAELRALGVGEPVAVVTTHGHFDHCFGNAAFTGLFWGHAGLPEYLRREVWITMAADDPDWARSVAGTEVPAPTQTVSGTAVIDLGDRLVEIHHLGRGHTGHDLVVQVPDAGVLFAGDLVEESGPPAYGGDSFPLDWPLTLTRLLDLRPEVIVPGHGEPVDRAFTARQRDAVAAVAHGVRETFDAGLDPVQALTAHDWPYDPLRLLQAVRRGHAQLAPPWE
ncbi:MBL fold metallo-hydrolase [Actinocorallia sp. API 0066]|uniref:MBL fold metallo-hydrolase n=1 Tax=Actinocorallia sp. API 0066 TaxID=2896846 RepID=UPI001E407E97|nr:MBL fold metallo-hydrolase [Actinocorallia sp. API 0066]MCD0453544.1 MBL fold metallo-hydrolase [Actinocorallia sp. API 0066]